MRKQVRQDELEEMVATLGQSFLGLTINCARCHDHKFDPISQKEYYQVAALLGGCDPGGEGAAEDPAVAVRPRQEVLGRGPRGDLDAAAQSRRPGARRLPQAGRDRRSRGPEGALRAARPTSASPRMPRKADGARPSHAGWATAATR